MRANKQTSLVRAILLAGLLIFGVFNCTTKEDKYDHAKEEKYELTDLSFFLEDLNARTTIIGTDGQRRIDYADFKTLSFEGIDIPVLSNKIGEDGLISTRDYGQIKIDFLGMDARMYLKPSQERQLMELKKSKSK